ncbi:hypothetical protein MUK42_07697 [Musa troglodytarum]|uniref:Uncharacterized protein n=1 Tax=Musa troglodytarum TaxID=320322 RepID=A0A9E7HB26_9LILI|nr:hypothetical protein MUK42_07697 [Musa troglodytarum]
MIGGACFPLPAPGRLHLSDEVLEVVLGGAGHRGGGRERPKEVNLWGPLLCGVDLYGLSGTESIICHLPSQSFSPSDMCRVVPHQLLG